MKINSAGKLLLVLIATAGLIAGALSLLIVREVAQVEGIWTSFDAQRSEKVRALDSLYAELGYGGMIHHLKNLVLRQYEEDRTEALIHLGGARAALLRYASLEITAGERQALDDLQEVLDQYTKVLDIVLEHILLGRKAHQIDPVVRVEDAPAFAALALLDAQTRDDDKCISPCKTRAQAELHRLLGYGGVIHHFKNYLIRSDDNYRNQAKLKLKAAFLLLQQYQQKQLTANEQQAVLTLKNTVDQYQDNLGKIELLISQGLNAETIDQQITIQDGPALQALNTLQREAIAESELGAQRVYDSLSSAQVFAFINLAASFLMASFLIITAWWLIRFRIVNPILSLTGVMDRLANDQLKTAIPATHEHNEIGSMAAALRIFKDNAHARQQAEAELRAVVDNAMDGIILIDTFGRIRSANPTTCSIFGYSVDELIGRNVKILMPEQIAEQHDDYLLAYLETGERHVIGTTRELEGQRKNGERFPLELGVTDIETEDLRLFLGMVRDISERKRLELMKNEFVSTVSHELRTPQTSILGSLGLIRGGAAGELTPQIVQMVDIAHNNAERLIRLINDILDTEKIESGRMQYRMERLDLVALVTHAIEENRGFADRHQVGLVLSTDAAPACDVRGDRDRLLQVMANLLSNAIKYSPHGQNVAIAIQVQDEQVAVRVSDHGAGIPEEFRGRIFQKFSQADSSDTRQKGGTGLGLAITKAIVEYHGGEIGFETGAGAGTTFEVTLPLLDRLTANESVDHAVGRVLVCEDDRDVATLLQMVLREGGLDSDVALDAEQAKTKLAQNHYLAMTLDLMLPGQDGISLLKELRAAPATQDLPVVVVSAKAREGEQELNGGVLNILDWMEKPINTERLLQDLHSLVHSIDDRRPRILHVEDDPDVAAVVQGVVEDEADIEVVGTLADARQRLSANTYQLVILDLTLPDGKGEDLLPLLSQESGTPTPVVVFSASEVDHSAAEAVKKVLVKTLTSNEQLRNSILDQIGKRR